MKFIDHSSLSPSLFLSHSGPVFVRMQVQNTSLNMAALIWCVIETGIVKGSDVMINVQKVFINING